MEINSFYKHSKEWKVPVLVMYVDDTIITGSDFEERIKLEQRLMNEFFVKNLRKMKYFLGIVAHSSNGIILSH